MERQPVRYYAKNLEVGSLRISSVPYTQELQYSEEFLVGDVAACRCRTDGLIDEVRISKGVLDYTETLMAEAECAGVDIGAIDSIILGPRDAYRVRSDRTINLRTSPATSANSTQKPSNTASSDSFTFPSQNSDAPYLRHCSCNGSFQVATNSICSTF